MEFEYPFPLKAAEMPYTPYETIPKSSSDSTGWCPPLLLSPLMEDHSLAEDRGLGSSQIKRWRDLRKNKLCQGIRVVRLKQTREGAKTIRCCLILLCLLLRMVMREKTSRNEISKHGVLQKTRTVVGGGWDDREGATWKGRPEESGSPWDTMRRQGTEAKPCAEEHSKLVCLLPWQRVCLRTTQLPNQTRL